MLTRNRRQVAPSILGVTSLPPSGATIWQAAGSYFKEEPGADHDDHDAHGHDSSHTPPRAKPGTKRHIVGRSELLRSLCSFVWWTPYASVLTRRAALPSRQQDALLLPAWQRDPGIRFSAVRRSFLLARQRDAIATCTSARRAISAKCREVRRASLPRAFSETRFLCQLQRSETRFLCRLLSCKICFFCSLLSIETLLLCCLLSSDSRFLGFLLSESQLGTNTRHLGFLLGNKTPLLRVLGKRRATSASCSPRRRCSSAACLTARRERFQPPSQQPPSQQPPSQQQQNSGPTTTLFLILRWSKPRAPILWAPQSARCRRRTGKAIEQAVAVLAEHEPRESHRQRLLRSLGCNWERLRDTLGSPLLGRG